MKNIFPVIVVASILSAQIEFNEGPYGSEYFDIAGPYTLVDLNLELGDVNSDNTVNILDIIATVNNILGFGTFTDEQIIQADLNFDGSVDILDIVALANLVLSPEPSAWDFETQWNGEENYIFFTLGPTSSTTLWNANDIDDLLENSPNNVHYFFLSNTSNYFQDVRTKQGEFDLIMAEMSTEDQAHWKQHLHFIPNKCDSHSENFVDAVCSVRSISIDRLQRWREVGYLGNPANFSGTYISYLVHEATYFNYEYGALYEPDREYNEITVFEREHYTGGWAATITQLIELPSNEELSSYSGLSVELLRGCPDANMNYSDSGCDDYDRIAHMYICEEDGTNCFEIARWITPFDRQPHHLTDISPFISVLRPGGTKMVKFQESGWPNSLLTLKLRLYDDEENQASSPQEFIPAWNGTVLFNPDYDENRPIVVFNVPDNATKVELVSYITGHGWGSAGCYNCAEFCNSRHNFIVNGGTGEFSKSHPNASDNNYCMELETIVQGVVPNQYGTWGYGRAGWCPGMDVVPYIVDITDFVSLGEENVIDYDACRVVGNNCVTPPTCQGDGYCPEIAMSSYLIISY
jgi:hypothetical protein